MVRLSLHASLNARIENAFRCFEPDLASICSRAKCAPILSCDVETQCWTRFWLVFHNRCVFTDGSTLIARIENTFRCFGTDLASICSRAKCAPILSRDVVLNVGDVFGWHSTTAASSPMVQLSLHASLNARVDNAFRCFEPTWHRYVQGPNVHQY
jgi:hypothetical protein